MSKQLITHVNPQLQRELEDVRREGKNSTLKTKAIAQARIKELESSLLAANEDLRTLQNSYERLEHELHLVRSRDVDAVHEALQLHAQNEQLLSRVDEVRSPSCAHSTRAARQRELPAGKQRVQCTTHRRQFANTKAECLGRC